MDKITIKKSIVLIIWGLSFFSIINCQIKKQNNGICYFIFKEEKIKNLTLLHGVNKEDTLLFVTKHKTFEDKKQSKCIQISSNMYKIDHINLGGDIIYFNYKRKVSGKDLKINVGSIAPGSQKVINSYSSFPYLIK
ncbi:MAG: hypothetical protein DI622_19650 [Chryseobacterium sp.]|uniref:hypothetical protein n=1 Tax=Chryseobacterium sp. TaxID=1871047 RepID=UPI000DB264CE|nr:hypothetical protein [Chryseobacterium sp.]MPS66749.1 hypothetical protein [Chryseobacterium sp.]PZU04866.1 MAG: hypothetical protein DI622_19650 [Chryseobacterium sp.]